MSFCGVIVLSSSARPIGQLGAWSSGVLSSRTFVCVDPRDALLVLFVLDVDDCRLCLEVPLVRDEDAFFPDIAVRST